MGWSARGDYCYCEKPHPASARLLLSRWHCGIHSQPVKRQRIQNAAKPHSRADSLKTSSKCASWRPEVQGALKGFDMALKIQGRVLQIGGRQAIKDWRL